MKEIPLTQGKTAIVDDADHQRLSAYKWSADRHHTGRYYAKAMIRDESGRYRKVYMHRFIMGMTDRTILVDHRDGDSLNCQRHNLRPSTNSQNQANRRKLKSPGMRGVFQRKGSKRFYAQLYKDKKRISLGSHATAEAAAMAYDRAAVEHFGEFAVLNYPEQAQNVTAPVNRSEARMKHWYGLLGKLSPANAEANKKLHSINFTYTVNGY